MAGSRAALQLRVRRALLRGAPRWGVLSCSALFRAQLQLVPALATALEDLATEGRAV